MLGLILICLMTSGLISFLVTALMRLLAPRFGLMDQPAARKVHSKPIPLGGGIGIWSGIVLSTALAQLTALVLTKSPSLAALVPESWMNHIDGIGYRSGMLWGILLAASILAVIGLIDDKRNLPWQPRLAAQFLIASFLVFGLGIRATLFVSAPWLGSLLSVIWLVALMNSFNFLDNMDALSSGIGCIASLIFALIMLYCTSEPRWLVGGLLLLLAGSLLGFLIHNRPPAKIFMGDSGSHMIGLLLGTLTLLGTFYEYGKTPTHVILAPLCVLSVPFYDLTSVVLLRLRQGKSPFQPDKQHFSHRLVQLGLSKPAAVGTIHITTLMTGLGGVLLYQVESWYAAGIVVLLVACALAVIGILEFAGRSRNQPPQETKHP